MVRNAITAGFSALGSNQQALFLGCFCFKNLDDLQFWTTFYEEKTPILSHLPLLKVSLLNLMALVKSHLKVWFQIKSTTILKHFISSLFGSSSRSRLSYSIKKFGDLLLDCLMFLSTNFHDKLNVFEWLPWLTHSLLFCMLDFTLVLPAYF